MVLSSDSGRMIPELLMQSTAVQLEGVEAAGPLLDKGTGADKLEAAEACNHMAGRIGGTGHTEEEVASCMDILMNPQEPVAALAVAASPCQLWSHLLPVMGQEHPSSEDPSMGKVSVQIEMEQGC